MAFLRLFDPHHAQLQRRAQQLSTTIAQIARQPEFYGPDAVPDTLAGRLQLLMLHGALVMLCLQAQPGEAQFSQYFVDRFFKSIDEGLREAGVGDLSVPKRMRRIAAEFYERLPAYKNALGEEADPGELARVLQTHVWPEAPSAYPQTLAAYARAALVHLQGCPSTEIHQFSCWPSAPARRAAGSVE